MIEKLDFDKHDPEDYIGKLISFNNCDYIIGDYVGSGMEKFVHKLLNSKSGLCLHIIKIYRDKEAEERSKNEKAAFLLSEVLGLNSEYNMVPEILTTKIGDKTIAIEEYIGPYESESSETHKLMTVADDLISKEDYSTAIKHYDEVLTLNKYHTVALNNISYCFAKTNDLESAFEKQHSAASIEPSYSEYRKNLIEYAATSGKLGVAETHFDILKNIFSYYSRLDELMVQVFRAIGKPEKVKDLAVYESKTFSEKENVDLEILTKINSDTIISEARNSFFKGDTNTASDKLKQAFNIYNKCGLHKVNFAFCLAREGDYNNAIELLLSSVNILHFRFSILIYFNIGLFYIRLNDFNNALKYLEGAAYLLLQNDIEDNTISIDDLPGIGMWIDESGSLEEPLKSSFILMQKLFNQANLKKGDLLINLYNIYNQAYRIQEDSLSK